jgi:hypothetical protein
MFSFCTEIFLFTNPRRELGRSMTSRGGESSVCTSGITGPPFEMISIAGTPRSCTTRTLVTVGGGPKVWAATGVASRPDTSRTHTDLRASRGNKSLAEGFDGNISLGMDAREEIGRDTRCQAAGDGRQALGGRCQAQDPGLRTSDKNPKPSRTKED